MNYTSIRNIHISYLIFLTESANDRPTLIEKLKKEATEKLGTAKKEVTEKLAAVGKKAEEKLAATLAIFKP